MKITELQIAKLVFQPGSVAVVKINHKLTQENAQHVREYVSARLPAGIEVLVLDVDATLSVVEKPAPAEKTAEKANRQRGRQ